jgi:hypothetical protein
VLHTAVLISHYTRAQALADGALVDVSPMAAEAGFVWPVAVTQQLWGDIHALPEPLQGIADPAGRLWDVLWMARHAIQSNPGGGLRLEYRVIMPVAEVPYDEQTIILAAGPGDAGEAVITLMCPGDD